MAASVNVAETKEGMLYLRWSSTQAADVKNIKDDRMLWNCTRKLVEMISWKSLRHDND